MTAAVPPALLSQILEMVRGVASALVEHPEALEIWAAPSMGSRTVIHIVATAEDAGALMGENRRMFDALDTLLMAIAHHQRIKLKLDVRSADRPKS